MKTIPYFVESTHERINGRDRLTDDFSKKSRTRGDLSVKLIIARLDPAIREFKTRKWCRMGGAGYGSQFLSPVSRYVRFAYLRAFSNSTRGNGLGRRANGA